MAWWNDGVCMLQKVPRFEDYEEVHFKSDFVCPFKKEFDLWR